MEERLCEGERCKRAVDLELWALLLPPCNCCEETPGCAVAALPSHKLPVGVLPDFSVPGWLLGEDAVALPQLRFLEMTFSDLVPSPCLPRRARILKLWGRDHTYVCGLLSKRTQKASSPGFWGVSQEMLRSGEGAVSWAGAEGGGQRWLSYPGQSLAG